MLGNIFSNPGFMPHIHCYLDRPALVATMLVTDFLIGSAYLVISITLLALVRRIKLTFNLVVACFGLFIAACGAGHFMEVWTLWHPDYWVSAGVKVITAAASVGTCVYLLKLRHSLIAIAESSKLAEQRRMDLEVLAASLEERVRDRTREYEESEARYRTLIEAQKKTEQALRQSNQAKDELISICSHELRTPVSAMKLGMQIYLRGLQKNDPKVTSPERVKRMVEQSDKQLNRLTQLIEEILDFSRINAGKLQINRESFNLFEMITEVLERMQLQFESVGSSVTISLDENSFGEWDRLRMEQVMTNLLSNALKYGEGKTVHLKLWQTPRTVLFSVRDEGMGIPLIDHERIFKPYERAVSVNSISGLGLGLYLSLQIVQAHGGTIRVESELECGSTFTVEVPKLFDTSV